MHMIALSSVSSIFSLSIITIVIVLCSSPLICLVAADPWSRSLPSGTQSGFPIDVAHLVVAQGALNHTLFAFHVGDGTPAWSIQLEEPLFPFCLFFHKINGGGSSSSNGGNGNQQQQQLQKGAAKKKHHGYDDDDELIDDDENVLKGNCGDEEHKVGVFQGHSTMYGIDLVHGTVKWTFRGLSTPVFLPTPMEGSTQFDGILTAVYVNASFPRCISGIDVGTGRTAWVNCDHTVYAQTQQDGAPLPVIVTEKTFFAVFEAHEDPRRSIVLERQLDDPVFPPHVFDFFPQTVMMTNSIGFITDSDNSARFRGGFRVKRNRRQHTNRDGQPIRVAFAVSGWNSATNSYAGATTVVSVIAQAGVIEWRHTLGSRLQQPIQFMIRHVPELHEMIVSDGASFISALATDSGTLMWNHTVNRSSTTSSSVAVSERVGTSEQASGISISLGPLTYVLQTRHHVFMSQHVVASSNRKIATDTTTDVITVLDVNSGAFVNDVLVVDSISSQFASHHNVLYIPGSFEVAVLNITNMQMRSLYLTHSPVGPLFDVLEDSRLVFGTAYTVYSFPLL
ncbi:membrane-associated protein, putative [Bodo saltans]|uniref:Membrane-associated protein, putative n=1 Tax=Bodo saltans TaxID=75058 RepID=A0A0S4J841_BODSA|nr:membrane-associated protein, putative [Bodo saltans]|eukprot:CUG87670.1 membrane-associated protein, putative [Bodo saltans]